MAVTMGTISAITKDIYEGKMREQLYNDVVALRRIESSSAGISNDVGGRHVTFPIHVSRNTGIGSRNEMDDLPKAGFQKTVAARIKLKHHYGSMALSGQVLKLADTNTQAFISGLDLETNGLKDDLAFNMNRQVYGTVHGNFAKLSNLTSTGADVDSGIDYLMEGQAVDLWQESNLKGSNPTPVDTGVVISSVTDNGDGTGTITFPTATVSNVDTLTLASSGNKEWHGLNDIVNNNNELYGIDPSNTPVWKAHVDDPGSLTPLSEGRIIKNVDKVRKSGGKVSLLLTSLGVRRSYFQLLVQNRQFVNTSKENKSFDGGFDGLGFTTDQGEVPMITDPYAPYNTLWGLSEKNLKIYREADWSFMDEDGSMWYRVPGSVAGTMKDAYAATMFQYSELGSDRRNVHFRINNIQES